MTKQCIDCRQILDSTCFGHSRTSPDTFRPNCKLCVNQSKRIFLTEKHGRLRPPPPEINDDILRNNLHHLRAFLSAFFHGLDYLVQGPCLHIPTKTPYTFVLKRPANSPLVQIEIQALGVVELIYGINRLQEDPIDRLCVVLRDYRIEPNDMAMRMAMLWIYDKV
jgi:hypothetical protein